MLARGEERSRESCEKQRGLSIEFTHLLLCDTIADMENKDRAKYKKPYVLARNLPSGNAISMVQLHAEVDKLELDELDEKLAEAKSCAQVICDRLGLALTFEKSVHELAVSSGCVWLSGDLRDNAVYVRPALWKVSTVQQPCKVCAFPKGEYKMFDDIRDLSAPRGSLLPDMLETRSRMRDLLPLERLDPTLSAEGLACARKRHELSTYELLFSLLQNRGWWIFVPSLSVARGLRMDLLDGTLPKFSSKEELVLKLEVHCPSFVEVEL